MVGMEYMRLLLVVGRLRVEVETVGGEGTSCGTEWDLSGYANRVLGPIVRMFISR
jgi:hypothetical protein